MHRKRGSAAVTGQYQHTIDAKGRLFIPAKLREELGDTFYVTMGMDSCLSIYSDASWARFTEKFESLPCSRTKAMRPLFANAAKCEPDAQGRIVLPQKLRAYAHLEKDVVVIGVSNRAEIWNAEKWAEIEAEELNPENLAAGWKSWDSDMEENYGHKPVLLHECLGALAIKPDGIYVDGTLGRAGHSLEIVRRLTTGRLIALDRDETAIEAANRRLGDYLDKVTLVHSNFSALDAVLHELGVHGVDGMLFDLGVSSPQLDEAQRGFSYKQDAPLDMRMDESAALTAREVVNTYSYEELRRILFEYGEERYAPAIAKRICQHREQKPIETTLELADIIRSAMPASALREKQHPAKRSFQAIRIAVNDELGELPPMLDAAEKNLKPGGRLAVITFHSLEDRIVKKKLQELAQGCICPPEFPVCVCGRKPKVKLITRKPIVSGEEELAENPRARSAKLRVAEKC